MVIVDSSVWIDYLANVESPETAWLERGMEMQRLGLLDLILCEVLQGIRDHRKFMAARHDLLLFDVLQTGGADLAVHAAENYRFLRSRGATVRKTIDCLIATFCLREGHALLHRDRDFDVFERHFKLQVIHPLPM